MQGAFIHNEAISIVFACTIYFVWKAHNDCIFSSKVVNACALFLIIQTIVYRVVHSIYPCDAIYFLIYAYFPFTFV